MTDVIVETEDGRRIHYYIDDGHPAIVYMRKGSTLRVKATSLELEREVLSRLTAIE